MGRGGLVGGLHQQHELQLPPLKKNFLLAPSQEWDYLKASRKGGARAESRKKPFKEDMSACTNKSKNSSSGI